MAENKEFFFSCPYCWEFISMLLDPSVQSQTFIEDCEVCCHPIQISYSTAEEEIVNFESLKAQ